MKFPTTLFIATCLISLVIPQAWAQNRLAPATNPSSAATGIPQLSVCYNKEYHPGAYTLYSLVVLDSGYPAANLKLFRKSGKIALSHLSLGKVSPSQGWFKPLAEAGALKPALSDSKAQMIDLNNPAWENLLIQHLIPQLLNKGFTGLFLDDLDLIYQQRQQGLAADLIGKIRKQFPQIKLMANGGLNFLSATALNIDYILLENLFAYKRKLTPLRQLTSNLNTLSIGKKINPKLLAYALEYYAPNTTKLKTEHLVFIATIRKLHMENGLISCVSVESLDALPIRPLY